MSFAVSAIAPVFALIALGFLAAHFGWLGAGAGKGLTEFTFTIAMPALLFRTMVVADIGALEPVRLWTAYVAIIAVIWGLATLANSLLLRRSAEDGAAFAMTASYSNIVLLGIPIAYGAYGSAATPVSAVILSLHIALLWLVACLHLAVVAVDRRGSASDVLRAVAVDLGRNPIVMAIVLGGLYRVVGIGLAPGVDRALQLLTQASVPCALFIVGFSLSGFKIAGEVPALGVSLALKNIAMPLVAWVMTVHVFAVPDLAATVIILFCAMPTGTATYLFASRNGIAVQTTSATVGLSTAVSMLTAPIVLALLGAR